MDLQMVLGLLAFISLIPCIVGLLAFFGDGTYRWADKWTGKMIAWSTLPFFFFVACVFLFTENHSSGGGDDWWCNEVNGEKECYRQKDIDKMVP